MAAKTLNTVLCPVCNGKIEGVTVEEDMVLNAKRVPIMVLAKCENGHAVVLFVDKTFTIRDVETAVGGEADEDGPVDKALDWMDKF